MRRRIGKEDAGYHFEAQLGAGGFGAVYRVRKGDEPPVAMKVLLAELVAAPQAIQRFEREIATIQQIDHPSCIKILESGRLSDGSPYFTMELLEGEDLSQRLRRDGRMSEEELRLILGRVCAALDEAHQRNIVHRDVKASNIFLCSSGDVKLLDFGIAKYVDMPGMTLTLSRQLVGTPTSMAPEQLSGSVVDARTDVYALGALAYYMLTGAQVFSASSATIIQHLHQHAARPRPSSRVPVSTGMDRVIVSAMSIEAALRPPNAAAFFKDLGAALDGKAPTEGAQARASAVFGFLGRGKQSEGAAREGLAAMDNALAALAELGYQALSVQSCGFVCTRVLDHDGDLEESELLVIRDAFAKAAPPGAQLQWKIGEVRCKSGLPWSGEVLVPRFEAEAIDPFGITQ